MPGGVGRSAEGAGGPVAVTGLGILSAVGRGLEATERALRDGRSGLGVLTLFRSPRCGGHRVAEVPRELVEPALARTLALARPALGDAAAAAGLAEPGSRPSKRAAAPALAGSLAPRSTPSAARPSVSPRAALSPERVALVVGTCVGGMPESEEAVLRLLAGEPFDASVWSRHACAATTDALADELGVEGPCLTISTACSSGAQALATGADLLRAGQADVVLAGGVDALCRLTLNGFASLLAADPDGCKPFDRARAGMSLGEGAAFCVLEREADARARGARLLARLAGAGNTCDAYHATAPEPEGRGAERALRAALAAAGRAPEEVDYVNAHGTGTPGNDLAEGLVLARVFGERMPPVSSTKAVFGHTLGAAGAIEAVVSVLALTRGFLPGTVGLAEPDPACLVTPLRAGRAGAPALVLSNSFGFGGNNTVLAFERAEAGR